MNPLSEFRTSEGRVMIAAVVAALAEGRVALPDLTDAQTAVIGAVAVAYIIARGLAKSSWAGRRQRAPVEREDVANG